MAAALAVALLPTLYGSDAPAGAERTPVATKSDAARPADAEQIDLTYVPTAEHGFVVLRPATIYEHLIRDAMITQWDGTIAPGIRMADFRQTVWGPMQFGYEGGVSRLIFQAVVGQSPRPIDFKSVLHWASSSPTEPWKAHDYAGWTVL